MPDHTSLQNRLKLLEQRMELLVDGKPSRSNSLDPVTSSPDAPQLPVVTADESDLGRAIRIVLCDLCGVVPYDSASVQELRAQRLVIVGGVGFADLDVIVGESFALDSSDSPNGEVIHRRRAMIVADTEQYRAFRRGLHVGMNIRSWLGVPLLHAGDLLGMITLDKQEPDFYTAEHQRIASAFSSMIARVMARALRRG